MPPLPIDSVLPQIVDALRRSASVAVRAPTGAGKSTRVPPALLDSGVAAGGRVVVLEPRRIAARAVARRIASERGGRLGDEVGYQVRFERHAGPTTRLLIVTEGILTRMLQDDPFLESVGMVVLDEFHERHLDTDLALGMLARVRQTVRPDLRIAVMSATLDVEAVARYLGGCPVIESAGRTFPVGMEYAPASDRRPLAARVVSSVEQALNRTTGDVLVFLPGVGEIRQSHRALSTLADARGVVIAELYGDLPAEQQDAVLQPGVTRKVVLATNVAETSVTIEGVTAVVDSGLARVMQFDSHVGLDRLRLRMVSKASADQRAGRAGRTQPGLCLRLWSEAAHRARADRDEAEIRRVDLAGPVLQLLCWGEPDIAAFPWFEPPRPKAIERASQLLRDLGALDDSGPTDLGRAMARLPVHPRIARLLLEGDRLGCPHDAALAGALVSERDPFLRSAPRKSSSAARRAPTSLSDIHDCVMAMEEYERSGRESSPFGTIQRASARFVLKARDQLLRIVAGRRSRSERDVDAPKSGDRSRSVAFRKALLAAYPDRVVHRREPASPRGVMVGGRGVVLGPESAVHEAELFLGIDIDGAKGEAVVRRASAIERDWLPRERLRTAVEVDFDDATERVAARRRVRYIDLVLEESPAPVPDNAETAAVLATAAAERWNRVFPPDDLAVEQFVHRVRCLQGWMPELSLPAFDDDELKSMLPEACLGCRSFADLRRRPWLDVFRGRLNHVQWMAMEREAPERIPVPSGSRIGVTYEAGRPPVVAVRIQEVLGLRETPRVAGGRVPVLLHLLAPNMRPQQITDDLASFWANGYPIVRKELRARYPKHSWPEDPTTAPAMRGARRRPTK